MIIVFAVLLSLMIIYYMSYFVTKLLLPLFKLAKLLIFAVLIAVMRLLAKLLIWLALNKNSTIQNREIIKQNYEWRVKNPQLFDDSFLNGIGDSS
jgi:hypothetical protein